MIAEWVQVGAALGFGFAFGAAAVALPVLLLLRQLRWLE